MLFSNLKNQDFSLHSELWFSQVSHHNCAWQRCDSSNKNLNQRTLVSDIPMNDTKKLWRRMYICFTSSHIKKRQRVLESRLFYDKEKQIVCCSTPCPLNARENIFCLFYCCCYCYIEKEWLFDLSTFLRFIWMNICMRIICFFSVPLSYNLFISKTLKLILLTFSSLVAKAFPMSYDHVVFWK